MGELDNLLKSDDPAKILEFYNHFNSNTELIKWMKSRPRAPIKIYETEGSADICVVIPTANRNNAYSKGAKKVYKGLKIIFVESSGPYFNFSTSANSGIKYALKKYKPDWIILSNDDVYKIDNIEVLRKELAAFDRDKVDVLFRKNHGKEHDALYGFSLYGYFVRPDPILFGIVARLQTDYTKRHYLLLFEKFKINYFAFGGLNNHNILSRIALKDKIESCGNLMCAVFSRKFVEGMKGKLFDETYINGYEDCDLCLNITQKYNYRFIDFRLGCYIGKSAGTGNARLLRDIANLAYFNYKLSTDKSIIRRWRIPSKPETVAD